MKWQGIRRDTDDTSTDGILGAVNVRYYSEGEIQRRRGMRRASAYTGIGIAHFRSTANRVQFAIILTTTGNLEAVQI